MFKLKSYVFDNQDCFNYCKPPIKVYEGDAGYDCFSYSPDITLNFGQRFKFELGFELELPKGWVALIQEKSGMAVNYGIMTMGNVIDSNYRGQCHATLINLGQDPVAIVRGQKVAQMLVVPCHTGRDYRLISKLTPSNRGDGGFGSTGLK